MSDEGKRRAFSFPRTNPCKLGAFIGHPMYRGKGRRGDERCINTYVSWKKRMMEASRSESLCVDMASFKLVEKAKKEMRGETVNDYALVGTLVFICPQS